MTTQDTLSNERLADMLAEFKASFVDQAGCTLDSDQSEEVYNAIAELSVRRATTDVTEAMVERAARAEWMRVCAPTTMPEFVERRCNANWRFYEAEARRWLTAGLNPLNGK